MKLLPQSILAPALASFLLLVFFMVAGVLAVEDTPPALFDFHQFYGSVSNLPIGTFTLKARVGTTDTTTAITNGQYGYSPTFQVRGGQNGQQVTFFAVNGQGVQTNVGSFTYQNRATTNLNFEYPTTPSPPPASEQPDTISPTVSITAPTHGSTISSTALNAVTVSAAAADNVGVIGVQFKLDGTNLGAEDTAAPYSIVWNATLVANGSHTLTARARDLAGNQNTSASVTVIINNTPSSSTQGPQDTTSPTVSLASPANGSTISSTSLNSVTVSATAADNVGVIGVQFKLDGTNLGAEDTTAPYSIVWNATLVVNGSHALTALARDQAGNQNTSAQRTIIINNTILSSSQTDGTRVCWQCNDWQRCINNRETRNCPRVPCSEPGALTIDPATERLCTSGNQTNTSSSVATQCLYNWDCSAWSSCQSARQTRSCTRVDNCDTLLREGRVRQVITVPEPVEQRSCTSTDGTTSSSSGLGEQAVCTPSAKQCLGFQLQQCAFDGRTWRTLEVCSAGCNSATLECTQEREQPPGEDQKPFSVWLYIIGSIVLAIAISAVLLFVHLQQKYKPVKEYIDESRSEGYNDEQIRERLLGEGWNEKKIDQFLRG